MKKKNREKAKRLCRDSRGKSPDLSDSVALPKGKKGSRSRGRDGAAKVTQIQIYFSGRK